MKTLHTTLLAAALLAATAFLVPGRSGLAQQSPPAPDLPADAEDVDPPEASPANDGPTLPAPPPAESPDDDVPPSAQAPAESLEPEVLTHGPVHEAFAEPVVTQRGTELLVSKPPPEVINEVPPEVMPEGDNVEWIPGYWGWDDEINDYIWVSGLWRRIPPGQRWVPGHWTQVEGGHTWVAGFWTGAEIADLEYLPDPPATLEQGPNVASPGGDHFWVPGSWIYQSSSYNWQPGYWAAAHDDWCWIPRRYVWTPRGSLFCGGYWDYRLPRRGVLFAPVRFGHRGFWGPRYRYRPSYTLNPAGLLVSLFVRPGYRHYYFGDYYGPRYRDRGFVPWHRGFNGRRHYDPLYTFYDSYYRRKGIDFGRRMEGWHDYFHSHPDRRPDRVLRVSTRDRGRDFRRDDERGSRSPIRLAQSLTRLAESRDSGDLRLRRVDAAQREVFDRSREQVRTIARHRSSIERRLRDGAERVTLPDRSAGENRRSPADRTRPERDRRTRDDRRSDAPSIVDEARDARGRRDGDSPRGTSRGERSGRLELPQTIRSRIAARSGDTAPDARGSSGSAASRRQAAQSPSQERDRRSSGPQRDRAGRDAGGPPGLSDRLRQTPSTDRARRGPGAVDRGERSDRSGNAASPSRGRLQSTPAPDRSPRGPNPRERSERSARPSPSAPSLRDRIQQTPRSNRTQQSPPSSRQAPRTRSTPPATGPDRGRSGNIQQRGPRQPSPQPRVEPRSSGREIRGRIESRRGNSTINRGSRSGNRPQIRSAPPQTRSQPQSRPQIRQRPQIRRSSPPQTRRSTPQIRSRSQSGDRGSRGRGSSGRGGRGGRGRR